MFDYLIKYKNHFRELFMKYNLFFYVQLYHDVSVLQFFVYNFCFLGCLGLKKSGFQVLPHKVDIVHKQKLPEKVFCGPDCSFIICADKSLLVCGSNRYGIDNFFPLFFYDYENKT